MYLILWVAHTSTTDLPLFSPKIAAKQAAAAATQTIAASQNAAVSNKNTAAHQQLVQSCKVNMPQPSRQITLELCFMGNWISPSIIMLLQPQNKIKQTNKQNT